MYYKLRDDIYAHMCIIVTYFGTKKESFIIHMVLSEEYKNLICQNGRHEQGCV